MKPVTLLFTLGLFCFTTARSQNRYTDTSATCIAFWKNKESRVYLIKHTKEKTDAGTQLSFGEGNYEAHIKVLDSTETGFKMEWVYRNFTSSVKNEYALSSLNSIMESLKIIYKTDDVGTFTELVNWEEVRDMAIANYGKAVAAKAQDKEFVAALNQVKAIFNSKENIEAILIKEVQLFHAPYGVEYTSAGMVVEAELPNVTGGQPFPATINLKLDELNIPNDKVVVSLNQSVDKGKAGPIIAAMLKKLSSKPTDEAEVRKQIKDMEISDLNQFTYTINSGWMTRIVYKRISNLGDLKQVEAFEITEKK